MDEARRLEMIHRMQEVMYAETPEIILDYPPSLEVVNAAKWDGWAPFMGGGVWYVGYNISTYLDLVPKGAEDGEGSSAAALIAVAAAAAAVVVGLVVWLALRARGGRAEED